MVVKGSGNADDDGVHFRELSEIRSRPKPPFVHGFGDDTRGDVTDVRSSTTQSLDLFPIDIKAEGGKARLRKQ